MRALVLLIVGCGSSTQMAPGWSPAIVRGVQPQGQPLVIEFPDGTDGTQLLRTALTRAREAGATVLGDITLQVGTCVRELGDDLSPVLADPVTFETTEADFGCTRAVDFQFVQAPAGGFDRKEGFRDTELVEHEDCASAVTRRVVTRERVDMEHRFVPPRWPALAHWSRLTLRAGPTHCDAAEPHNQLRIWLYRTLVAHGAPTAPVIIAPAEIFAAVAKARGAADPTDDAIRALQLWSTADLAEGQPPELAAAVAEAGYLALERDARTVLATTVPAQADGAWMQALDRQIEALAQRYMQIGAVVLLPVAKPWLIQGALRLAQLHDHVAALYDGLGRAEAARHQRASAAALRATSR